jgi:hypothetical protein
MTNPKPDPILTSDKLTALHQSLAKQKANAAQCRAEVWRLTTLLSPASAYNETSSTVWDADVAKVARIGLLKTTQKNRVVSTPDGQDEAARRKDAIERTLAGETIVTPTSLREQLESENLKWSAAEDAIEFLIREIQREKTALAIEYSKKMKPKHDALMKSFCQKQLEAHAVWRELYDLKRHLIDSEVGLRSLCLTTPDFLGAPNDPRSEMGDFFRAAKSDGFISTVPVELRL